MEGENNNQSEAVAGQNAAEGDKSAAANGSEPPGAKKPAPTTPPLIDTEKLAQDMAALKPTIFLAFPTTYALLYQKI